MLPNVDKLPCGSNSLKTSQSPDEDNNLTRSPAPAVQPARSGLISLARVEQYSRCLIVLPSSARSELAESAVNSTRFVSFEVGEWPVRSLANYLPSSLERPSRSSRTLRLGIPPRTGWSGYNLSAASGRGDFSRPLRGTGRPGRNPGSERWSHVPPRRTSCYPMGQPRAGANML